MLCDKEIGKLINFKKNIKKESDFDVAKFAANCIRERIYYSQCNAKHNAHCKLFI
jgi:hypothetical protein